MYKSAILELLDREDGGSTFSRNISNYFPVDTTVIRLGSSLT